MKCQESKPKEKMKILVTGSTGFIGSYVVSALLRRGYDIIATSRDEKKAREFEWFSHVTYKQYDINSDKRNIFEYFQKPDLLVHLAWEGLPNYRELFHIEKNLFNHYEFIKTLIRDGLENIVVTGTCLEYGMQNGQLHEALEAKPNTPYALGKDTLRRFLEQLQTKVDFKLKWLRLFYMYGQGQNPNSIISQLEETLDRGAEGFSMSGGEQLRDYLPVETVAEYITLIALQDKVYGVINCCSGTPISIRSLLEQHLIKIQKSIKLNLGYYPYPDYEPMAFWGDTRKLKKIMDNELQGNY